MTEPWPLPSGWYWATFGDIATIKTNLVDPADYSDHLHLAPNHIESGSGHYEALSTVTEDGVISKKHLFEPGVIVYSKIRPYLRKAVITRTAGLCSADMYPIETELENRYLLWWMLTDQFTHAATKGRSVIPKINQRELKALPVPVPPFDEQRRIVELLERQLTTVKNARSSVARLKSRNDRLVDVVAHQVRSGSTVTRALEDVAGITLGPAFKSSGYVQKSEGRRLLRSANIGCGTITWDGTTAYWPSDDSSVDHLLLAPGDTVLTMKRPIIAEGLKVALVTAADCPALLVQGAARIRPNESDSARWIFEMIRAPGVVESMLSASGTSTGPPYASATAIRATPIPWPASDRREELLRRLMTVRTATSRLTATGATVSSKAHDLRRSILKAAFEGRLASNNVRDAASPDDIEEALAS